MAKRIAIIGAGIGGLSTGCYAAMNGYDTEIFESHSQPGGNCTAWKRKGYTVDGCIHWLTGSGPANSFYKIWKELGAVQDRTMHDREAFCRFTATDGRTFVLFTDPDRLERHMKELSPADSAAAQDLCRLIRKFACFQFSVEKAPDLMGTLDGAKMLAVMAPYLKDLPVLFGSSLRSYAQRFTDPLIREAIATVNYDETLPLMSLVMTLGPMSVRAAGFPLGGSLEFAKAIEKRYRDLGGKVTYRARVEKILEESGRAVGVRLVGGVEMKADYVVSAMDMRATLYSLMDGTRIDPVHRELFDSVQITEPCVQVSFGADMDFSGSSDANEFYQLETPVEIAGKKTEWINFRNYSFDPSLAPAGKSVVSTFLPADWDYWQRLSADPAAYGQEKQKIAAFCAAQVEERHPGFRSRIEMTDVATPITWARYTGNWKGAFMTWKLTGEFQQRHRFIPKTVPGLDGLYLASMWTCPPGGLPGAALAGRNVAQIICKRDGKRFASRVD